MTTIRDIAKAHGRTIRTVRRWVGQAKKKYPDMGWDTGNGKSGKVIEFSPEQVLKVLEFAPVEPASIPQDDQVDLLEGELVEVAARESTGLALHSPTAAPGLRIASSSTSEDLEQAKSLSLLRAGQINNSVCSFGDFFGRAITGELAREASVILANGKEAMQNAVNDEIKKAVG